MVRWSSFGVSVDAHLLEISIFFSLTCAVHSAMLAGLLQTAPSRPLSIAMDKPARN